MLEIQSIQHLLQKYLYTGKTTKAENLLLALNLNDLNYLYSKSCSILWSLALNGSLATLNLLIDRRPSIMARDASSGDWRENGQAWQVLSIAIKKNKFQILEILLSKMPELLHVTDNHSNTGNTLLHEAAKYNRTRIIIMVLRLTPNSIYDLNHDNQIALHVAVAYHRSNAVNLLAKAMPKHRSSRDIDGKTPVHTAIETCSIDVIKLLMKDYPVVEVVDNQHRTILHIAAQNNNYWAVRFIVRNSPQLIQKLDVMGQSALEVVPNYVDIRIFELLISVGTPINKRNSFYTSITSSGNIYKRKITQEAISIDNKVYLGEPCLINSLPNLGSRNILLNRLKFDISKAAKSNGKVPLKWSNFQLNTAENVLKIAFAKIHLIIDLFSKHDKINESYDKTISCTIFEPNTNRIRIEYYNAFKFFLYIDKLHQYLLLKICDKQTLSQIKWYTKINYLALTAVCKNTEALHLPPEIICKIVDPLPLYINRLDRSFA